MAETFDLIVRGGEVVNHAGRGMADVGVRGGKIAAVGDLGQAVGRRGVRRARAGRAAGRDRQPGAFPRARAWSGRKTWRPARARAVLGGVTAVFEMPNTEPTTTDADALADKLARAKGACTATTPSMSAARTRTRALLGELERLPGCCGVKVFMGASTGTLLVPDDEGVEAGAAPHQPARGLPLRGRIPPGRAPAAGPHRRLDQPPGGARRRVRHPLHPAAGGAWPRELGKRIHVLHVTTAEEIEFLAAHKDVASVELTPQHLTLAAPEAYERLKGFAQMNPPIRDAAPPRRRCGAASPRASPTCWAPTTRRTPARKRRGPIPPRPRACRACRPWCRSC